MVLKYCTDVFSLYWTVVCILLCQKIHRYIYIFKWSWNLFYFITLKCFVARCLESFHFLFAVLENVLLFPIFEFFSLFTVDVILKFTSLVASLGSLLIISFVTLNYYMICTSVPQLKENISTKIVCKGQQILWIYFFIWVLLVQTSNFYLGQIIFAMQINWGL